LGNVGGEEVGVSIAVQALVWKFYPGKGEELLLALKLADHCNDDGRAIFAKVETMASMTRQSVRTVQRQLRSMEESGWLVVSKHTEGGRGRAREYAVNPSWLANPLLSLNGSMAAFVCPDTSGSREESVQSTGELKGDMVSPFIELKGDMVSPFIELKGDSSVTLYDDTIYKESINHPTCVRARSRDGKSAHFDLFWKAWPSAEHKKRRQDCERLWLRGSFDAESQAIMSHVHAEIVGSERALREGGKYLVSPKSYLAEKGWRDAHLPQAVVEALMCVGCGVAVPKREIFTQGGKTLCVSCFRKDG
jgi:hypothetical protein